MRRWKHRLAAAGFAAALAAVATDRALIGWIAIALLGAALALRLIERARERRSASARDNLSAPRDG